MSSPYKPNTASMPNILFDYWMSRLSPGEFKVLMGIARKTFGWNKQRDRISLRQLTELTGLHKSNVIKCCESLIELGLVIKIKSKDEFDGSDAPNQYEINVDCQVWGIAENEGGSRVERLEGVAQNDTPPVAQNDTQNTLYTKHTIQKSEARSPRSKKATDDEPKISVRENIQCTQKQYDQLKKDNAPEKMEWMLNKLESAKGAKGYKYVSDYHTMINGGWVQNAYSEAMKSGKVERPSTPVTGDNAIKNKRTCEAAEVKLSQRYTANVFFQAGPNSALLVHTPKDFKKEYHYEAYEHRQLTELLLRDLETVFPGARDTLIPPKSKVGNLIEGLVQHTRMAS